MSARRPLLTSAAAGSLLVALWFVPSANATGEDGHASQHATGQGRLQQSGERAGATGDAAGTGGTARTSDAAGVGQVARGGTRQLSLADTGNVDTTPYLVGGTVFLGCGAALVAVAARRARHMTST